MWKARVDPSIRLALQLKIKRIAQLILAGKVSKQRPLGNPCTLGDSRRRSAQSRLCNRAHSGVNNRLPLLRTLRPSHVGIVAQPAVQSRRNKLLEVRSSRLSPQPGFPNIRKSQVSQRFVTGHDFQSCHKQPRGTVGFRTRRRILKQPRHSHNPPAHTPHPAHTYSHPHHDPASDSPADS